ncbi:ABC transporter substrate-binding protein [Thermus scotoductus]|uniref:ABC transporter substrate-binding protein n=2 Tax=Thermus scotoductus TaxID=37636 RepID=A0A430RZ93_THESC|nr:ABC transporter substrate-binding protein [Thermus scotoductus]ADW21531.1 leucine-, isoleucine-, valine-, threonine-, and alanine-binding protein [Thermus scotoductus SA-01]RTG91634.1 ABC transporter substrate-binding protein [Thermus scotoductus]RTH26314.1 ABC transporter substrate-binding protein [Thermus scotoductus]RTH32697.1 ABC transporter substrate-binding protein [Thermus scotoductus]RTI15033.1 ABC transporter substrate-binding protein [Thermus scotoductus]
MRKVLGFLALVTGLAFAQTSLKVGVILPLSGASAVSGKAALNGIQLAADEVNTAGKVRLELVVVDDGTDAAKAVPAFTKLMTVDKVDIVIGGLASGVTFALSGPVKQYGPLFLVIGAASSVVEQAFEGYPLFFHYHPWDYHNVAAALQFFQYLNREHGARKVAILYEDGPFGSAGIGVYKQQLEKLGYQVQAEPFKAGSGQFTAILTRFRAFAPDILYWIGYDVDALPIATQARQVGLRPKLIYGAPPSWPIGFEKNPLSNDIAGMTAWLPTVANAESRRFVEAYRKKYGEVTEEYMAPMGYTIVKSLALAAEKAGSADKNRIAEALASLKMNTPFGPLSFKPSDTGRTKYQGFGPEIWFQFQYLQGSRRPVFPKEVATRPLRYPGEYYLR